MEAFLLLKKSLQCCGGRPFPGFFASGGDSEPTQNLHCFKHKDFRNAQIFTVALTISKF
jgi:hypothetical protein